MEHAELESNTTRKIFRMLRQKGHREAALDVAEKYMQQEEDPQVYLRENVALNDEGRVSDKIGVIKKLRSIFDLRLKEAKAEVDRYEDR